MSPRRLAVMAAVGLLAFLSLAVLLPSLPTNTLVIRVDVRATSGDEVAVFLNGSADERLAQPLIVGERTTYTFARPGVDLSSIRIDIENTEPTPVTFYGVEISDSSGLLASFSPAELASWSRDSYTKPVPTVGGLLMTALGPDPKLSRPIEESVDSVLPGPVDRLAVALKVPQNRLVLGMLVAAGAALLAARRRRRTVTAAGVAAAAALAGWLAFQWALTREAAVAPPTHAVGRATYIGESLGTNTRAVLVLLGVPVLVAVAAVIWSRRRPPSTVLVEPPDADPPPRRVPVPRVRAAIAVAATIVVVVAALVPNLRSGVVLVDQEPLNVKPGDFDDENVYAWAVFSARGLVVMRDFWYPYGNAVIFNETLVAGSLLAAAVASLVTAAFAYVSYEVTRHRVLITCLATLAFFLLQPTMGDLRRYVLALIIALAYTTIDADDRQGARVPRVVFGALVALGLALEPILVAYAGVGVLGLLAVDAVRLRSRGLRWWLRRLVSDFAIPVAVLLVAVGVAAMRGQLAGTATFYGTLGESATYSARPTPLIVGVPAWLSLENVVLWAPAAAIAAGLFLRATQVRLQARHGIGSRLLVIALVGLPLLQKHAVRPLPTNQLLLLVSVPVLLVVLATLVRHGRSTWTPVAVAGIAAAAVTLAPLQNLPTALRDLPIVLLGNAQILLDPGRVAAAEQRRFSDERFGPLVDERAVDELLEPRVTPGAADLFVLGDAPLLYALLEQRPPWQVNVYNTSPLRDQKRVLRWLETEDPELVVLDRRRDDFDDVPNSIRIPLLYRHVIDNYVFEQRVGTYDVLVPLSPGAKPDVAYWVSVLGPHVELRGLPAASDLQVQPCLGADGACADYLVMTTTRSTEGMVEIPLTIAGRTFIVSFAAVADQREYVVPVDRLWPAALGEVIVGDAVPEGWTAAVVRGEPTPDRLY